MSTTYHTAIVTGESNDPSTINTRLSTLDAAIVAANLARSNGDTALADQIDDLIVDSGTSDAETIAARTSIPYNSGSAPASLSVALGYAARNIYNALAWGCVGDDSTDNRAAIVDAVTDIAAAGGGILYFPEGTYRVVGVVAGSAIQPKTGVYMMGAGKEKTILKRVTDLTKYLFIADDVNNVTISDMTLDGGSYAAGSTTMVEFQDSYNLTFERVRFQNTNTYCLLLDGCHTAAVPYQNRIVDCDFIDFGTDGTLGGAGVYLTQASSTGTQATSHTLISGCRFSCPNATGAAGQVGIRMANSGAEYPLGCSYIQIRDCNFDNLYDNAVAAWTNNGEDILVENCTARTYLLTYGINGDPSGTKFGMRNGKFVNCVAHSEVDCGFDFIHVDGFGMIGCTADTCGLEGVKLQNVKHGQIVGNHIVNCGNGETSGRQAGIRLSYYGSGGSSEADLSEHIVIDGNVITDTRAYALKTQLYGVQLANACRHVYVSNNDLRGNKTAGINDRSGTAYGSSHYHIECFYHGNMASDRPAYPNPTNLLASLNPSFEDWTGADLDNWTTTDFSGGGTGTITEETTTFKYGATALRITQTNTTSYFWAILSSDLTLDLAQDYVLSGWVYVPASNTPTIAGIGYNGFATTDTVLVSAEVGRTGVWQYLRIRFNTAADAVGRIWCVVGADGANDYAIFDGLSLVRGSVDVGY